MSWQWHNWLGPVSIVLWFLGVLAVAFGRRKLGVGLIFFGTVVTAIFIAGLWIHLERPPLKTMGETRLWYAFLLSLAGVLAYRRWSYLWLLIFSATVSAVFVIINLARPEIHSKTLPPALQSFYFVPHVVLYMLAYSLLAAAAVGAVMRLSSSRDNLSPTGLDNLIQHAIRAGLGLIMLGLITGALWAKEAWGHYWSWDPKETWALVTLAAYLISLHLAADPRKKRSSLAMILLPLGFLFLMITWLGLTYLPTAPTSVHVY
ncbi:MAG: cytochrome c biogenesis protein CcsA [Deltaproteobacteria bacterium]|jgi:ABC-type transport system involved in cytochrome c biogenesis permease subunit|nr:cytochrome c biogenesis protein CcsA [Deltaproteobacteria bacterium]